MPKSRVDTEARRLVQQHLAHITRKKGITREERLKQLKALKDKYPEEFAQMQEANTQIKTALLNKLQFDEVYRDAPDPASKAALEELPYKLNIPHGFERNTKLGTVQTESGRKGYVEGMALGESSVEVPGDVREEVLAHEARHADETLSEYAKEIGESEEFLNRLVDHYNAKKYYKDEESAYKARQFIENELKRNISNPQEREYVDSVLEELFSRYK